MDPKEFEKIMARRKARKAGVSVSDDNDMGIIEEGIRGIGRGAVGVATAPAELLDITSRLGTAAGSKLAGLVTGQDSDKLYQEKIKRDREDPLSPLTYTQKILDVADKAKQSGMLKGSESIQKKWKEGVKDVNWWVGHIAEAGSYSGILAKSAHTVIKNQGKKHLETLASKTATKAAKSKAKKEIAKIGSRAIMAKSSALGGAMSHGEYRNWEKENPESATIMGDVVSSIAGAGAGAIEGITIGGHLVQPFIKKFGRDAGTKAATKFYKEVLKSAPKHMATEAGTEAIQTVIENVGVKLGYDQDKEFFDGVAEAAIIGGAIGGGFGVADAATSISGKDVNEKDALIVAKARGRVTQIKSDIDKYSDTIRSEEPGSRAYIEAEKGLERAEAELIKQKTVIGNIVSETAIEKDDILTDQETIPTDQEAFGTTIDPTLTIEEIATGVDKGEITKKDWEAAPKNNYTEEEIAVVDQHVEDIDNENEINNIIETGQSTPVAEDAVVDGTADKKIWSTLEEDFTDEDAVNALDSDLKTMFGDGAPTVSLSTTGTDETVSELSGILGVRVVPVSVSGGKTSTINGVVAPGQGKERVIYINDSTPNPEMWVFGHEFGHSLQRTNPEGFKLLLDMAVEGTSETELGKYKSRLDKSLGLEAGTTATDTAHREMLSDFMGDKFNDKNFWDKVYKKNPTKFKEVITSLKQYIQKIIASFKGVTPKSDKFFNNVMELENTLNSVLNEHVGYTGAIEQISGSKIPTGVPVDLNEKNRHWTHIPIGDTGQILLREDGESIRIKRLARSGARTGTAGMPVALNVKGRGEPTAIIDELKAYAEANNKNIIAEAISPYFAKQGFKNTGRTMTWEPGAGTAVVDEGAAPLAAPSSQAAPSGPQVAGAETAQETAARKLAEKDRLETSRRIREIDTQIGIERDVIETSTSREDLTFAKENIDKLEAEKKGLEAKLPKEKKDDKEIGQQVPSDGQRGKKKVRDTSDKAKGKETDRSDRDKQGEKGKEVTPKKTLEKKIQTVKREADYKEKGGITAQLLRITDSLNDAGKHGDGAAFAEATIAAGIEINTAAEEVAYHEAFVRHMRSEENDGAPLKTKKKKAKTRRPKRSKEQQTKLNVLTALMLDDANTDTGINTKLYEEEIDKYVKDVQEEETFLEETDKVTELQFSVESNRDSKTDILKQLNTIFDGYDIIESDKQNDKLVDFADSVGVNLLIVKNNGNKDLPFGGMGFLGKSGTGIAISDDTKYPDMFIFGHEFSHVLQGVYPEDFNKLFTEATKTWSPSKLNMYREKWSKGDINKNDSEIRSEMVADFVGSRFNDVEFWNNLYNNNPSLFKKIVSVARSIITKLNEHTKTMMMGYNPKAIFNGVDNMNNILSKIVKDKISGNLRKSDIVDTDSYYRGINNDAVVNFLLQYTPGLTTDASKFNNNLSPKQNVVIFIKAYVFASEMGININDIKDNIQHFPYGDFISDITGIDSGDFKSLDNTVIDVVSQFVNKSSTYNEIKKYDDKINSVVMDARFESLQFSVENQINANTAFISPLVQNIKNTGLDKKFPKSLPASDWVGFFRKLGRRGKINPEEFEFTFLPEWLSEQEGKVTREQVIGYLKNNAVKVNSFISDSPSIGGSVATDNFIRALENKEDTIDFLIDRLKKYIEIRKNDPTLKNIVPSEYVNDIYNRELNNNLTVEQKFNRLKQDSIIRRLYDNEVYVNSTEIDRINSIAIEANEVYEDAYNSADTEYMSSIEKEDHAAAVRNEYLYEEYGISNYEEIETSISDGLYEYMKLDGGLSDYAENLLLYDDGRLYKGTGSIHWDVNNVIAHLRYDSHNVKDSNDSALMLYEAQSDWQSDIIKEGKQRTVTAEQALKDFSKKLKKEILAIEKELFWKPIDDIKPGHAGDVAVFLLEDSIENRDVLFSYNDGNISNELYNKLKNVYDGDKNFTKGIAAKIANDIHLTNSPTFRYLNDIVHSSIRKARKSTQFFDQKSKKERKSIPLMVTVGFPNAPFKKTWPLLTFKHAMIQAHNRGNDYVAWPSTEDQLSKIQGWKDKSFKGVIDNYTKKLPRLVNEFVKQYGGKVEQIEISGGHKVNAVKMTPQMDEMVANRQVPQFSVEPIDPKDPNPEAEKQMIEASKTTGRPVLQSLKNWVTATWKTFTSPVAELRPGKYGFLKDKIRLAKEVDKFGSQQAFSKIYKIIGKLSDDERTVFTRVLILNDILNDTAPNEDGTSLLKDGHLPFGYKTVDEVRASLRHFREQAKKSPRLMRSLAQRRKVMLRIQGDLIDAGFLPEDLRGNDSYFHHETLQHMVEGDSYLFGIHRRTGDKKLGMGIDRGIDINAYSTDYIVSEFRVISDAVATLELNKLKILIRGRYDKSKKLLAKAKGGEIIIPKGYTKWTPSQHSGWGSAPTYPDLATQAIMAKAELDPDVKEKLQIASGMKEEWIIPEEMASGLSRIREVSHEAIPAKISNAFTQAWKRWVLINPLRIVRYNINNMSGDLDIAMAYDWRILQYMPQAMKDIAGDINSMGTRLPFNMQRYGSVMTQELKDEMKEAHRTGVVGAGFVMHEVTDIANEFEAMMRGPQGGAVKKFGLKWWQASKDITNYRENILRLASYRYFKDRIATGEKNIYGASNPLEIDEINNKDEKAAKLSRELIGDYGRLSEGGEWMRRHMVPFYSWMEINAPRYVRMMRNLKDEGKSKKGAAAASLTWKGSVLGAKFMMFGAMVTMWNNLLFGDDEDQLQDDKKRSMHLLLGRRSDGSIRYLPISGAFRDALSWFDGEDAYYDITDITSGESTVSQKLTEAGMAPMWKFYHSSRPFVKLTYEVSQGMTRFPKNELRPIRDKMDYVAKSFSMELAYRYAAKKPTRGMATEYQNKLYYNVDPGESAYYAVRNKVNKFNKGIGKGNFRASPTDKSNALYYYKQAIRYGDLPAAERYWKKYLDLGGSVSGLNTSVKLSRPTGGLQKKDRKLFYKTLSDDDKELLNKASKWYRQTYQGLHKRP